MLLANLAVNLTLRSFEQQILNEIGISLGVIYQLYDDIIDAFGNENKAGKSLALILPL